MRMRSSGGFAERRGLPSTYRRYRALAVFLGREGDETVKITWMLVAYGRSQS